MSLAQSSGIVITAELARRATPPPDHRREKLAFQDLARRMADDPALMLPELVKLAMELCEGDAAGISILEGEVFRWYGLVGRLSAFEGTTTPRNDSPCGVCLDELAAVLMKNPETAYDWIAAADITVPEVLLVPLLGSASTPLGTLWIVAREDQHFNAEHARVMTELASFTGAALHMVQSDERLKKAVDAQHTLLREMRHRMSNLFAVADSLVQMTAMGSTTKEEMTKSLSGRLRALSDAHSLVRASFNAAGLMPEVELKALIGKVLKPYRIGRIDGGSVLLGMQATNNMALVLYELATNAAKYGALSTASGAVDVSWTSDGNELVLDWRESGGPPVTEPTRHGFGGSLIQGTIGSMYGKLTYDWAETGLTVRLTVPVEQLAR